MQMKGEMSRIVRIYVDSYENEVLKGRFCMENETDVQTFRSLTQLLKKVREKLDAAKFPQAFDEIRTFQPPRQHPPEDTSILDIKPGAAATFSLRILFRQNASWQGAVLWHEGRREESFRSVLELLFLLDSALSMESSGKDDEVK